MNKQEFFKSLGFGEYEAKTLISIIKQGKANAKEISFDSGVPQNKLYTILKKFQQEGILAFIPGESKAYKAINIETYIQNKIKAKEQELKDLRLNANNINNKEQEEEFVFSFLRGQLATLNSIAENSKKAKTEIIGIQRNWKVWRQGLREMNKSIRRGVKVKIIGVINEETKARALEWKKLGCEIRAYNKKFGENPLRFTILDNKLVRLTIGKPEVPDPKDYITIWTKSRPLIATLRNQFLQMWKESKKSS